MEKSFLVIKHLSPILQKSVSPELTEGEAARVCGSLFIRHTICCLAVFLASCYLAHFQQLTELETIFRMVLKAVLTFSRREIC